MREVLHQADRLGFEAAEVVQLQHVLAQALAFVQEADELLEASDVEHSLTKVEALYATGSSLGLNLPQCFALEKISKRMRWLSDLDEVDESSLDLGDIESYLDLARQNDVPAEHAFVKVLEERLQSGLVWKRSAEMLLQVRPRRLRQHYKLGGLTGLFIDFSFSAANRLGDDRAAQSEYRTVKRNLD